jgi:hypothetical protein
VRTDAIVHPQLTWAAPARSSQLQPLKAFLTHAHVALPAHSGSQPHAGPPGALSSQYQPLGHRAAPQGLQVPSSHVGFAGSAEAVPSESPAGVSLPELSSPSFPDELSVDQLGESATGVEPPQATRTNESINLERRNARGCPASIGL